MRNVKIEICTVPGRAISRWLAPQNFAILRRIALKLLKNDKRTKLGIANKRLKAGWNVDFLAKLLGLVS